MRSALFFILSVSLHVAALLYPVSFGRRSQAELVHVTILPLEQEQGGTAGQGGHGSPARRSDSKSHRAMPHTAEPTVKLKSFANPEPQVLPGDTVATISDSSVPLVSAATNSAERVDPTIYGPRENYANDSSTDMGGTGAGSGNGFGSSGRGFGRGSGNGKGSGSSGTGIGLTQASYRDTPRPAYPASARREGREGRVLLRVLVDAEGRTKQVQINDSSGSDVLDRAATEAIKRWRFHPARYGDKAVEIWLRIPIEFRLADAKPG